MIGQTNIIEELTQSITNIKAGEKVVPHILLYGERGMGKTTLAKWVAEQIDTTFSSINGGAVKKDNLSSTFMKLKRGDVLFIDEIHSLKLSAAEELYTPMQDFKYNFYFMKNISELEMHEFTLIGATTEAGKLPKPLIDRFVYSLYMEPYTDEEITEILKLNVTKEVTAEALHQVVALSCGNPRTAINFLISVELFSTGNVNADTIHKLMELRGIDSTGMSNLQMKYLAHLNTLYVPVGRNFLSTLVGISESMISDHVEPLLIHKGFIVRGQNGRLITPKGRLLFV